MELTIYKSSKFSLDFLDYLITVLRSYIISNIPKVENTNLFSTYKNDNITIEGILTQASKNLKLYDFQDRSIIKIDPTINYNNTQIKLITLCKLLNYGNLENSGSYIFTNIFNQVSSQLNSLYSQYMFRK